MSHGKQQSVVVVDVVGHESEAWYNETRYIPVQGSSRPGRAHYDRLIRPVTFSRTPGSWALMTDDRPTPKVYIHMDSI